MASIDGFVGQNFVMEARWAKINPHMTKIVLLPKTGICFPLKQKYEQANCTLEDARQRQRPPTRTSGLVRKTMLRELAKAHAMHPLKIS